MPKNKLVSPVVKWVGGKRQLLPILTPMLPKRISTYCEPFLGGGALLFSKQPKKAFVNDINPELINLYQVIKNDVDALISLLQQHQNTAEYFYELRDQDRNQLHYSQLSNVERASRMLFLNKTCFNGLYRVNSSGMFNSPFGNYKNPNIVNAPTLKAVSNYFNSADITFSCGEFADILNTLPRGSFVYLDPPYDPVSSTANFTGYSANGFGREQQILLRECCDNLNERGIKFMLSNSATQFIQDQYQNYTIDIVQAKRSINSDATKRGEIDEVVIRNYGEEN